MSAAPLAASVHVETDPPYEVRIGRGLLGEAASTVRTGSRAAIVADEHVESLHGAALVGLEDAPRILVPRGEEAKRLSRVEAILESLAAMGFDREATVVALGGGATCDVAGLAASLYLRGVDWIACPTTLLAQVDASVGGKTAVDLSAGRNLAGTFHQPRAVLADVDTLATLDPGELRSGLGEVLKMALIEGGALVDLLEDEHATPLGEERTLRLVEACVRAKARIVAQDEREAGERAVLNLGHTFAHGIEHAAGTGRVRHGEAVACGLLLALAASRELGLLEDAALPGRVVALCERLDLPSSLAELERRAGVDLDAGAVLEAMRRDKKARGGRVRLVLPRAIGRLESGVEAGEDLLRALLSGG